MVVFSQGLMRSEFNLVSMLLFWGRWCRVLGWFQLLFMGVTVMGIGGYQSCHDLMLLGDNQKTASTPQHVPVAQSKCRISTVNILQDRSKNVQKL